MLGAGASVTIPTFFTLDLLGQLAQQGRFGRALPPHEQASQWPAAAGAAAAAACRLIPAPSRALHGSASPAHRLPLLYLRLLYLCFAGVFGGDRLSPEAAGWLEE
jgi:hypothetical protein